MCCGQLLQKCFGFLGHSSMNSFEASLSQLLQQKRVTTKAVVCTCVCTCRPCLAHDLALAVRPVKKVRSSAVIHHSFLPAAQAVSPQQLRHISE